MSGRTIRRGVCAWLTAEVRSGLRCAPLLAVAAFGALLALLSQPFEPAPHLRVEPSAAMVDRNGRLMSPFLNVDEQWCFPLELDGISPYLVQATIAVEDQRFHAHPGVDPIAVARAALQNVRAGRVESGASTLTMQLVKLGAGADRSPAGKFRQALDALKLNCRVDKRAQLEAYLNRAPYGLNLVGCEAAARRYFGKTARELTLPEAALLAGLPKSPTGYMPLDHADAARARRDLVLKRMAVEGLASPAACARAMDAPLGVAWHEFPALSRHFAIALEAGKTLGTPDIHRTTLDASLQARVEALVGQAIQGYDGEITNAAVMVVDVPSAAVLARVGSADFFNTPGGGQVDATAARRSPGSTLKPFIYAVAMARQVLYPDEVLLDGTLDYGLYNPENYDGLYRGTIAAGEALRRSLNVPAVTVLARAGEPAVHGFLRDAGLTTVTGTAEHYGLGITLGNCEARLDELTRAYCMLANLGELRPLRMLEREPVADGERVLPRDICVALFRMMEQPLPDELDRNLVQAGNVPARVCWKTGTSTGHRDAWAFVFNARIVVGVWMGNNDASPSRWLAGARSALPLAGRVFRSLDAAGAAAWPESGEALRAVNLCARTGLPASRWCPHMRAGRIPAGQYVHRTCDVHYPGADGRAVAERWPGTAKAWDLARVESPIRREPGDSARTTALRIVEPAADAEYLLTGEPGADRIRLRSTVDAEAPVHWFLNDRYLGKAGPDTPLLLDLTEGRHKLACVGAGTSGGGSEVVRFTVARAEEAPSFRQ